jgi:hypothetical protein
MFQFYLTNNNVWARPHWTNTVYFVEGLKSPVWEETVHELNYHRLIEEGDEYTQRLDWDADESDADTRFYS